MVVTFDAEPNEEERTPPALEPLQSSVVSGFQTPPPTTHPLPGPCVGSPPSFPAAGRILGNGSSRSLHFTETAPEGHVTQQGLVGKFYSWPKEAPE